MRRFCLCVWLICADVKASAINCQLASTSVERAICTQPELVKLDANLNEAYQDLQPNLTAKARLTVVAQQRAWVAERDRLCATGNLSCFRKEYTARLDQVRALKAAAQVATGLLSDLHPFVVTGSWRATSIYDPGAKGAVGNTDLAYSLFQAQLPAIGGLVSTGPGRICEQGSDCQQIAWTRTTLIKVMGAKAMNRVLSIPLDAPVLVGDQGAKEVPLLTLVPRGVGVVWAIFILTGHQADTGRYVAEEWTPVGPSYTVSRLP